MKYLTFNYILSFLSKNNYASLLIVQHTTVYSGIVVLCVISYSGTKIFLIRKIPLPLHKSSPNFITLKCSKVQRPLDMHGTARFCPPWTHHPISFFKGSLLIWSTTDIKRSPVVKRLPSNWIIPGAGKCILTSLHSLHSHSHTLHWIDVYILYCWLWLLGGIVQCIRFSSFM